MWKQKVTKLGLQNLHFLKSDEVGVDNWPKNRLLCGRGSEKPVVRTQQKLTQATPA